MDDAMIEQMTEDPELRRRLEAYAEARLSPDAAASSRIRARVLAVAHRQADLARTDAALAVLPRPVPAVGAVPRPEIAAPPDRSRTAWRRAASVLLAASLGVTLVGTALAARPGGPLYDARMWAETLTLPDEASARAVAELDRLTHRLQEAMAASRSNDSIGAAAALTAYETIVDQASSGAIIAGDAVASAALQAGVAQNIDVLRALSGRLPDRASEAISAAIERAIARSGAAIEAIDRGRGNGTGGGNGSGGSGGGNGSGGAAGGRSTDRAPAEPTTKPTKPPTHEPVAKPTPTPKPDRTPPGGGKPPEPPGGGGQGGDKGGG